MGRRQTDTHLGASRAQHPLCVGGLTCAHSALRLLQAVGGGLQELLPLRLWCSIVQWVEYMYVCIYVYIFVYMYVCRRDRKGVVSLIDTR